MVSARNRRRRHVSPSSRRAWIEILHDALCDSFPDVALLAEGVDRNVDSEICLSLKQVALLAEGVDRNAPRESLNRPSPKSPSSRRAWIEIILGDWAFAFSRVALLAEGVDRNHAAERIDPAV